MDGRTRTATFPFARLAIRPQSLALRVWPFGKIRWEARDIVSIEKVIWFPVVAWGIRISYGRASAPSTSYFWWWGYPGTIIKVMRQIGFPIDQLTPKATP